MEEDGGAHLPRGGPVGELVHRAEEGLEGEHRHELIEEFLGSGQIRDVQSDVTKRHRALPSSWRSIEPPGAWTLCLETWRRYGPGSPGGLLSPVSEVDRLRSHRCSA